MIEEITKEDEQKEVVFNEYLQKLMKLQAEYEHIGGALIALATMTSLLIGFTAAIKEGKITVKDAESSMQYSLEQSMDLFENGVLKIKDDK